MINSKFKKPPFAKKSFGQNFLVDGNYINKIIAALAPREGETIVEIGAGRGALTEKLIEIGANVAAIELERNMIAVLREKFAGCENFTLIERDALAVDYAEFQISDSEFGVKLIANLPYNISTAILKVLIEQRANFSEMILMFQREVVERIVAAPGNKERGFLSVTVQAYLNAEKLFEVPPKAFRPAPKVWSSVARLTPKTETGIKDEDIFRRIVSAGFVQKRKTIANNLKNAPEKLAAQIEKHGGISEMLAGGEIDPSRRAETLTLAEWINLSNFLAR